jgi:hypothetical protein
VPPGELDKTVLVKEQSKQQSSAPAGHIGPTELVWPGSSDSEVKAPPPKHE